MPRKGQRSVVVDGRTYRWSASVDRDSWGLRVAVEEAGRGGQVLTSGFFFTHHGASRVPALDVITPGVVRRLILAGLAGGRRPGERGLAPMHVDGGVIEEAVSGSR